MKGLILKDILCLKSYGRTAILFAVIWLLISLIGGSASLCSQLRVCVYNDAAYIGNFSG